MGDRRSKGNETTHFFFPLSISVSAYPPYLIGCWYAAPGMIANAGSSSGPQATRCATTVHVAHGPFLYCVLDHTVHRQTTVVFNSACSVQYDINCSTGDCLIGTVPGSTSYRAVGHQIRQPTTMISLLRLTPPSRVTIRFHLKVCFQLHGRHGE